MKKRTAFRIVLRVALVLAVVAVLLLGVGMLPGNIEGAYRRLGSQCMCDSVNFILFRDGRVILYGSGHPPGDLIGRYETGSDGSVRVFMTPYKEGEAEKLVFTATPRLWFTRFRGAKGESARWCRKSRIAGIVEATIEEQEIASLWIAADGTVKKTFHNASLEELRTETKQPKSAEVEHIKELGGDPAAERGGRTVPGPGLQEGDSISMGRGGKDDESRKEGTDLRAAQGD